MEKVLLTLSPEQKEEFVNRYYDLIAKKPTQILFVE